MRVLVTGATGFVGGAVIARLIRSGLPLRAAVRCPSRGLPDGIEQIVVGDIATNTDWHRAVTGVDTVVHLAARAHVMRDRRSPLVEYRRVNVTGTLNLAREAAVAGVRRFVFLSSVKVNGESGLFSESDTPAPRDPYGVTKQEAESGLRDISSSTGLEVVIVRAPLVYGPGVRANFRALMRAVAYGVPLPFGAVRNRRSLVAVENLADFIFTCITHPAAANETFLVSDGEDVSTADVIRLMAHAMGRPVRLVSVPVAVLFAGAVLLGRRDVAQRLLCSLQVDISKARRMLDWSPPVSILHGITTAVGGMVTPISAGRLSRSLSFRQNRNRSRR